MPAKTPEQRLDAQAKAIRALQAEVKSLREMVNEMLGATPVAPDGQAGVFTAKPVCLMCGKVKHPSRIHYLTCHDCGKLRQTMIRDRKLPLVGSCGNCGTTKTGTALLCTPCSKAYKIYRASH